MLCRFSAAYTPVGQLFLLKRNTSGCYAGGFFYLILARFVSAPHCFDKSFAVLCKSVFDFFNRGAGIGVGSTVGKGFFIHAFAYFFQSVSYCLFDIFKRVKILFPVVPLYCYAFVVGSGLLAK